MIVIAAKVKCDDCEAEAEVSLTLSVSKENNIPKLDESLPEGWGYARSYQEGEHYCPEHKLK